MRRSLCAGGGVVTTAALCSLAAIPAAHAQSEALAAVEVEYLPPVGLDPRPEGMDSIEVGFAGIRVGGALPIRVGGAGTLILPAINYAGTGGEVQNDPGGTSPDSFHELGISIGVMQPIGQDWRLLMNYSPSLATNFKNIDGDHFRFAGAVIASKQLRDDFAFGFGGVVSYVFGDLLPLPAAIVEWRPNPAFRLNLFFPESARLRYRFFERVEVGVAQFLQGNRYTIDERDNPELDSLKYTLAHAGGTAAVRLFSGFWLAGYGGYAFFRKFELYDSSGTKLNTTDLLEGPIARAAIEFRPPLDLASERDQ